MLDPIAMAILTSLGLRPSTAAELGARLGFEAEAARGHLRRLLDRGQVVVAGRVRRAGRLENVYLPDPRATVLDPDDLAGLPRDLVAAANLALTRTMFREAASATRSGSFERRVDSALTRFLAPVGDLGLSRALELHRNLLDEVVKEIEGARERIDRDAATSIATSVQILCFEHPIERWPRRSGRTTVRRRPDADRLERLIEQLIDPLRNRILEYLSVFPASAATLAELLDTSPERVRYELDRLSAEGMVKVLETRSHRGAVQRVFATDPGRTTISTAELAASERRLAPPWNDWVVRSIFRDALLAVGAEEGSLFLGRIVTAVDAPGFARIGALAERALGALSELRDENLEGKKEGALPDRVVLSGLLVFERGPAPRVTRARG